VTTAVRTATLDDAAELAAYAAALFAERLPGIFRRDAPTLEQEVEFIRSYLEPDNSTLLVAVRNGVIVGIVSLKGDTLEEEAHVGTFAISVAREARGQGVGSALIEALVAWAPGHGISRIQGFAWENNPGALRLYERLGFEREGLMRRAIVTEGAPVDAVVLAMLLD